MSSLNCDKCGAPCLDSPNGYTTGCEHYPPDVPKASHPIMRDFNGNPFPVTSSSKWMPKIKPLVWEQTHKRLYESKTPIGVFACWKKSGCKQWFTQTGARFESSHEELDEAKAACEQEYERRVRECLE